MSLTTIGTAFVLVAIVFIGVGMVTARWAGPAPGPGLLRRVWPGASFEALILTLLAALWFGSLGYGGWVTLFLRLGALPAGDRWPRRRLSGAPAGGETRLFVASLLKYLLAGLVCVWRLT